MRLDRTLGLVSLPQHAELDDRSLIPGDDARIAPTRFEDWLVKSAFAHEAQRGQTEKGSA